MPPLQDPLGETGGEEVEAVGSGATALVEDCKSSSEWSDLLFSSTYRRIALDHMSIPYRHRLVIRVNGAGVVSKGRRFSRPLRVSARLPPPLPEVSQHQRDPCFLCFGYEHLQAVRHAHSLTAHAPPTD